MKSLIKALFATLGLMAASPSLADTYTSPKGAGSSFSGNSVEQTVTVTQSGIIKSLTVTIPGYSNNQTTNGYGVQITLKRNGKNRILLNNGTCATYQGTMDIYDGSGTPHSYFTRCNYNNTISFRPYQTISDASGYGGTDMQGDWTLQVWDRGGNGGKFGAWSIAFTYDVPTWNYSAWSAPSKTCGTATFTRTATCKVGTTTVADSVCTGPKEDLTKTESVVTGCTYAWTPGNWTPVYAPNSQCGAKTETTTYSCQRSDGTIMFDKSFCTAAKPSESRPYNDPIQCTYHWDTSAWTTANPTTCGTSTRTRLVRCFEDTNNGVHQGDDKCLATSPKPTSSEVISDYSQCGYGWYRTGYELSPCIGGKQTYRGYYSCKRADGTTADGFCGTNPPRWVVTQTCNIWRESWGTGGWFGGIYPGSNTTTGNYSAGGTSNGSGIVSGGADGQGGDSVGIGNSSTGSGNSGGNAGTGKTGGTYDPVTNIYTDQLGNKHTGGYYDSNTGAYYGGNVFVPTNPAGSIVMMRRPVPSAPQ